MRCAYCNSEIHPDSGICPVCGTSHYAQNSLDPASGFPVEAVNRDELSFGAPPPRKSKAWIWVVTALALVIVLLALGFFLFHIGTEATCTMPSECIICGKILEEATGHDWEDATCTDPKTCKYCGKTKGSAAGHDWKSATCTEPMTCQTCGKTEGSAADHDWKDATCTEPMTCATCGKTEGNAAGHDWKSATCTAPKTCKTCGVTEGSAAEHDWKSATCTEPMTCQTCGKTEGSAAEHDWKSATCTAPKTCKTCGKTSGSAAGHDWKSATCTAPKTCKTCGKTSGSAAGHRWKAATLQAPKTCKVCGITEGDPARPEETYLAEMDYNDKYGKLWIRSEKEMFRTYHADAKDLDVWKDYSRPGNTVGAVYDIWGNRYQYGLHIDGYDSKDYYVSYYLGGNYTRFTAWCAFPMDPLSKNSVRSDKYVEIWADGEFLYATPVMDHTSPREYIDLNITGVRVLTIRYPATVNNNEAATLYDAKVS